MRRSARYFAPLPLLFAALLGACGKSSAGPTLPELPPPPPAEFPESSSPFPGPLDGNPWVPKNEIPS